MRLTERLNVIMIVVDSARRDRFGCYGYSRGTTPAIDNLARAGTVFERMIVPGSWTLPTHASLITGLYPREHGADRPLMKLREGIPTIATHLKRQGYETIFASNNPLISQQTRLSDGANQFLTRRHVDRGFSTRRGRRFNMLLGRSDSGAAATGHALRKALQGGRRPFFAFINYMECHWPYTPPRVFERRFVRRPFSRVNSARHRWRTRERASWENVPSHGGDVDLLNDLYDASLAYIDCRIGDLLADLDRARLKEGTIIIVTADHGENIGDHGVMGHGFHLHQTLVHVPFVVWIPERSPARISGLVQSTDVFAGLCRLIGIEFPETFTDRPFAVDPFALRAGEPGRLYAFAERPAKDRKTLPPQVKAKLPRAMPSITWPGQEAVQDERYKLLVEVGTDNTSLFDLAADPGESRNRASDLPGHRDRLAAALEEWRVAFQHSAMQTPYTAAEERAIEAQLRDLGYM